MDLLLNAEKSFYDPMLLKLILAFYPKDILVFLNSIYEFNDVAKLDQSQQFSLLSVDLDETYFEEEKKYFYKEETPRVIETYEELWNLPIYHIVIETPNNKPLKEAFIIFVLRNASKHSFYIDITMEETQIVFTVMKLDEETSEKEDFVVMYSSYYLLKHILQINHRNLQDIDYMDFEILFLDHGIETWRFVQGGEEIQFNIHELTKHIFQGKFGHLNSNWYLHSNIDISTFGDVFDPNFDPTKKKRCTII